MVSHCHSTFVASTTTSAAATTYNCGSARADNNAGPVAAQPQPIEVPRQIPVQVILSLTRFVYVLYSILFYNSYSIMTINHNNIPTQCKSQLDTHHPTIILNIHNSRSRSTFLNLILEIFLNKVTF